jgi:hypothetical protein
MHNAAFMFLLLFRKLVGGGAAAFCIEFCAPLLMDY